MYTRLVVGNTYNTWLHGFAAFWTICCPGYSVLDDLSYSIWMICCPGYSIWMICCPGYSIWMICCPGYSILDYLLSRLQCFWMILQKLSNAEVIHTCMNQYSCMVKLYCVSIYSCMDLLIITIFSTIFPNCPCYNNTCR